MGIQQFLAQIKDNVQLLLRLPWYAINSLLVSTRPRPTWSFKRSVMIQLMQIVVAKSIRFGISDGGTHEKLKLGKGVLGTYVEPVPDLITGKLATWAANANVQSIQIPGYWMHRDGVDLAMGEKPSPGEKVLLYMHGGGYVSFSAHPSSLPSGIPKSILSVGGMHIMRSFSIEYRLAKPDAASNDAENPGPFPAALLDALAGYNYLVNKVGFQSQDVILVGDSAGGNLALALCRYLTECQDSGVWKGKQNALAPPGGMILVSPWADLGDSHSFEGSYVRNAPSDMLTYCFQWDEEYHSVSPKYFVAFKQLQEVPDFYSSCPYVSPASRKIERDSVSFKGWPRALICGGGAEMFCDQIRELKDRMLEDMGEAMVEYVEAPDAVHDYFLLTWHEPERTEFLEIVGNWMSALS